MAVAVAEADNVATMHSADAGDECHIGEDESALGDDNPAWQRREAARNRQIMIGKARPEYRRYLTEVPKMARTPSQPSTPDPRARVSKRQFDRALGEWRRRLHDYDTSPWHKSSCGSGASGSSEGGGRSDGRIRAHMPPPPLPGSPPSQADEHRPLGRAARRRQRHAAAAARVAEKDSVEPIPPEFAAGFAGEHAAASSQAGALGGPAGGGPHHQHAPGSVPMPSADHWGFDVHSPTVGASVSGPRICSTTPGGAPVAGAVHVLRLADSLVEHLTCAAPQPTLNGTNAPAAAHQMSQPSPHLLGEAHAAAFFAPPPMDFCDVWAHQFNAQSAALSMPPCSANLAADAAHLPGQVCSPSFQQPVDRPLTPDILLGMLAQQQPHQPHQQPLLSVVPMPAPSTPSTAPMPPSDSTSSCSTVSTPMVEQRAANSPRSPSATSEDLTPEKMHPPAQRGAHATCAPQSVAAMPDEAMASDAIHKEQQVLQPRTGEHVRVARRRASSEAAQTRFPTPPPLPRTPRREPATPKVVKRVEAELVMSPNPTARCGSSYSAVQGTPLTPYRPVAAYVPRTPSPDRFFWVAPQVSQFQHSGESNPSTLPQVANYCQDIPCNFQPPVTDADQAWVRDMMAFWPYQVQQIAQCPL